MLIHLQILNKTIMTEKNRERLYWAGFAISLTIAILAGLNLLTNLIVYLLNK